MDTRDRLGKCLYTSLRTRLGRVIRAYISTQTPYRMKTLQQNINWNKM